MRGTLNIRPISTGEQFFFICSSLVDIVAVGIHRDTYAPTFVKISRRANTRRSRISESRWVENGGGRPFELTRYLMYSARALHGKLKFTSDGSCERLPWNQRSSLFHRGLPSISLVAGDNAPPRIIVIPENVFRRNKLCPFTSFSFLSHFSFLFSFFFF